MKHETLFPAIFAAAVAMAAGCFLSTEGTPGGAGTGAGAGSTSGGGEGGAAVSCGDGELAGAEACDDGNTDPGDGCDGACQREAGFDCTTSSPTACVAICNDGLVVGPEGCDDGNVLPGDGCSGTCQTEPGYVCEGSPSACHTVCGDGVLAGVEVCDDGNTDPGDGCDAACAMVEPGFACEPGSPSVCAPICGDGMVVGTEQCEDGNTLPGDGCDAECRFEATCGNGEVEPGEECDSGVAGGTNECGAGCELVSGTACFNSLDLNDPAVATKNGNITVYNGTNQGAPLQNFADPHCERGAMNPGAVNVPMVLHRYRIGEHPASLLVETLDIGGSLDDTIVWAYLDCFDKAMEFACDDDNGPGNYSVMTTKGLPAGTMLFIIVAGFYSQDVGPYSLEITEIPQ